MKRNKNLANDSSEESIRPSRSAKKRESTALQKLGEELTLLKPNQRNKMDLPAELADAINLLEKITDREGRRRQKQYIGRLMRDTDADKIKKELDIIKDVQSREINTFQKAEEWRQKLLNCSEIEIGRIIEQLYTRNIQKECNDIPSKEALLETINQARIQVQNTGKKNGSTNYSKKLFRDITQILNNGQ